MKKKQLVAVLVFLAVMLSVFLIWFFNRPDSHPGQKDITLDVFHGDGTSASFNISTSSDNLRGALEQIDGLLAGEDSMDLWFSPWTAKLQTGIGINHGGALQKVENGWIPEWMTP